MSVQPILSHGMETDRLTTLAETGSLVAYFGYGSLVNRLTLRTDIVAAARATLSGWRREWQARPATTPGDENGRDVALLTGRRDPARCIDGLVVFDHRDNLPAVDLREIGYRRRTLSSGDFVRLDTDIPDGCPIFVYEADAPLATETPVPILNSYLDAVLQGFLTEHGERGLDAFIDETAGFDRPVIADRATPFYPRAVRLAEDERALIDDRLKRRGLTFIAP